MHIIITLLDILDGKEQGRSFANDGLVIGGVFGGLLLGDVDGPAGELLLQRLVVGAEVQVHSFRHRLQLVQKYKDICYDEWSR